MQDPIRAAAYCRVSTDREDQSNSLASQKKYFAEYIENHADWQLVNIYYDEGISGTQTKNRTGFNSMVSDACEGKIDLILTKEVSRFARNTVDTLSYTRKLKEAGIGVIFTIDNIDTRAADGELRLTIMASIAQEESRKTSERVKWGQKRRMEQGIVFGRNLLGYTVKNGILFLNDSEVPIVRAIFHKYTNEKKSTPAIAKELLLEGIHPKQAQYWSSASILRILRNEKYAGDLCQKKSFTPNYLTHERKANHAHEELIYLENHHQPIIDRDLWNRTQEELQRRSANTKVSRSSLSSSSGIRSKSRYSTRYWCSGKLFCGNCGRSYVIHTKKRADGSISRSWRCYEAALHGSGKGNEMQFCQGCSNPSIHENTLVTCIQFCLCQAFLSFSKGLEAEILQELSSMFSCSSSTSEASCVHNQEKEIQLLKTKKEKALDLYLDGLITKEDFKNQCLEYEKKCRFLIKEQVTVRREHSLPKCHPEKPEQSPQTIENIRQNLTEILDFCQCKTSGNVPAPFTFLQEILEKVIIYPDKSLSIWLHDLPFFFHLKIHTHGKLQSFTTDILSLELLSPECS